MVESESVLSSIFILEYQENHAKSYSDGEESSSVLTTIKCPYLYAHKDFNLSDHILLCPYQTSVISN